MIVIRIGMILDSIINGMNHLGDRGQETSGGYHLPPPPLGVVFLQHVTIGGIGVLYVSTAGVWGYVLVAGFLSNRLLVLGGIYFY